MHVTSVVKLISATKIVSNISSPEIWIWLTKKKRIPSFCPLVCDTYNGKYGFQVTLESDQSYGTLVFQNVITNVGNGYDPRTGYFTPRSSGTFVFTWNVQSFGESVAACLEVNDIEITYFQTIQWASSIYKKDSFAIINLNANDVVRIRLLNGTAKSTYTVFNGWKQSVTGTRQSN